MVMLGAVFVFVTKSVVREEISKLNEIYLRKELAEQKFAEIEKHFDYLRDGQQGRFKTHGAD